MKKMKMLGIFLVLILMTSAILPAEATPGGEVTALPEVKAYDQLVSAIRGARAEARVRVEKAVERERVREAWEIGRLIDAHVLQHKERADYAEHVLGRLSGDLGMSGRELYYSLRFYRAYPILPRASKLSWSEYRDLLSVNDPEERQTLAERTEKENWTRGRLREEIRNVTRGEKPILEEVLTAEPGIPHTYRVVRGTEEKERVLDLGFSNYYTPAKGFSFQEKDILQVVNGEYRKLDNATEDDLYTYEIKVLEVLDGDTIKALIDLGFGFRTVQKLRLRGIDAPEIMTADGMESKAFLEKELRITEAEKQEKSLPLASGVSASSVLIRTVKSDKYDRYLADLFIALAPNGQGRLRQELDVPGRADIYINQKLIDEGMAVRVEE
ncbi:MAG: DUF1016 N-terminal domain-containing protein [Candidatus Omnitrophota bacterium]